MTKHIIGAIIVPLVLGWFWSAGAAHLLTSKSSDPSMKVIGCILLGPAIALIAIGVVGIHIHFPELLTVR